MLPTHIETPRLLLRAVREGDGAIVREAVAETFAQLHPWMQWAKVLPTPEESEAVAREAAAKFAAGTNFDFNALLLGAEEFVCRVGVWPLQNFDEPGVFEIGYWCRTSMQRRGYTSEAVLTLCETAPKYLSARRLVIRCDSRNLPSQNLARRLGFALREVRPDNTLVFSRPASTSST